VNRIDEVSQQNATFVEHSAAAAQSLQDHAGGMEAEMGFFTPGGNGFSSVRTVMLDLPELQSVVSLRQLKSGHF
jgi:hypothetical protein